jgi:hypothetical protein
MLGDTFSCMFVPKGTEASILMLRNLICPISSSRTFTSQPFKRLVASRAMSATPDNIAMVYTRELPNQFPH